MRFRAAFLGILIVSVIYGCGFKSAPIAPERSFPARIGDLKVSVIDGEVLLIFTLPAKKANGKPLEEVTSIKIYRTVAAADATFCTNCGERPEPLFEVTEGLPPPGEEFIVRQRIEADGTIRAAYAVSACSGYFSCGKQSSAVEVDLGIAPQAPPQPQLKSTAEAVLLAWPEVEKLADGRPLFDLIGYRVTREGGDPVESPLLAAGVFIDLEPLYGRPSTYTVRAVRLQGRTEITGAPSPAVTTTVIDLAPPPVPRGLSLSSTPGQVRLRWEKVGAGDTASIRIYRRRGDSGEYARLAEVPAGEALFIDNEVAPATTYFYKISAVDASPAANESASSLPRRITTESR